MACSRLPACHFRGVKPPIAPPIHPLAIESTDGRGVARVRKLKSLLTNEDGQDLLEYALIIGLLALAGIISLHTLSNSAFVGLNGIGNAITSSV